MVPKTPIAWRRREKVQPDSARKACLETARYACHVEVRVQAIEAALWGGRQKAPEKLRKWTDDGIDWINARFDGELTEAKAVV